MHKYQSETAEVVEHRQLCAPGSHMYAGLPPHKEPNEELLSQHSDVDVVYLELRNLRKSHMHQDALREEVRHSRVSSSTIPQATLLGSPSLDLGYSVTSGGSGGLQGRGTRHHL